VSTPVRSARPDLVRYGPDQIRAAVGFEDVTEPVARALADFSRGLGEAPVAMFAPGGHDGDVHVKSAWLPGRSIFTVKVATWFAARAERGDPPGGGIVAAFDVRTGDLRALLEDECHLTDSRTAAAGALAARFMARADASVLGVLGSGVQAYLQSLAAAVERPVRTIRIWARQRTRAERLGTALLARRPDLSIDIVATPERACHGAHLMVTATASLDPLIQAHWLRPGMHVTAVGADDAAKCELAPDCLAAAGRIVVDSRDLSSRFGDVARALASGAIAPGRIAGELGEVAAGRLPGRSGDDEITICKLIGLGVQDLAAAEVALERLESGAAGQPRPASALDLQQSH
jgi:ornithine cyclodeaminase/alanine dehydrogenase-like protein (mu-crystallin family)